MLDEKIESENLRWKSLLKFIFTINKQTYKCNTNEFFQFLLCPIIKSTVFFCFLRFFFFKVSQNLICCPLLLENLGEGKKRRSNVRKLLLHLYGTGLDNQCNLDTNSLPQIPGHHHQGGWKGTASKLPSSLIIFMVGHSEDKDDRFSLTLTSWQQQRGRERTEGWKEESNKTEMRSPRPIHALRPSLSKMSPQEGAE